MTTLSVNTPRAYGAGGWRGTYPVIADDIIFEGAAVGLVEATGLARPLAGGDVFVGFSIEKADNSGGAASAIDVEVRRNGQIELSVSGAVITDVGQPVYATDDDTFVFLPTGGSFVGVVTRFVSSGLVEVTFDLDNQEDPYGGGVYETLAGATKTLDIEDSGKTIFCTVTTVVTMPATAVLLANCKLVCMAPYGTAEISVDPVTADAVLGPDVTGVANKDYINTLATAQRGDFVTLTNGDADGPKVVEQRGTWAEEA